jgi:hypothetical protein
VVLPSKDLVALYNSSESDISFLNRSFGLGLVVVENECKSHRANLPYTAVCNPSLVFGPYGIKSANIGEALTYNVKETEHGF